MEFFVPSELIDLLPCGSQVEQRQREVQPLALRRAPAQPGEHGLRERIAGTGRTLHVPGRQHAGFKLLADQPEGVRAVAILELPAGGNLGRQRG
ncbi:hypothetical protein LJR296_007247 [Cupriavidus necator]|uniref:hypothetical protein n=1 Tax=Cupriavidus necator TaxID=106590 RepID=UPI003ECC6CCB